MNNISLYGTLDSVIMRDSDKQILLVVEVQDDIMEMPQHVSVDVTSDLGEIYKGVEFDKAFVKRIEKKLKLTSSKQLISIYLNDKNEWKLHTSLKFLYSPVLLTPDKVKFGDPLVIKATLVSFKRLKEGKDFPMSGLLAQCIIAGKELPEVIVKDKVEIEVIDKAVYADDSTDAYVDLDYEFDFIYNELKANKCCRDNFTNEKDKLVKRQEVYNRIAKTLLGKTITLEYDEHFGYSIWDLLIYLIDEDYK